MNDNSPFLKAAAQQSAEAAIEKQLWAWGFSPEYKAAWHHFRGNAANIISGEMELAKNSPQIAMKALLQQPEVDLSGLTTTLAVAMGKAFAQHPLDVESTNIALSDTISGTSFKTPYDMEQAIIVSLTRIGVRAALQTFNTTNITQPIGVA